MRTLRLRSQTSYANGSLMCTSGSVCAAVGIVTGVIDLQNDIDETIVHTTEAAMELASHAQGKVERLKGQRGSFGVHTNYTPHAMLGAEEMLRELGINAKRKGIGLETFIICEEGGKTKLESGFTKQDQPMLYIPESCFITLEHLPECIIHKDNEAPNGVACTLTCNDHTICIMYRDGLYALFDPMPAVMILKMNRQDLIKELFIKCNIMNDMPRGDLERPPLQADATLFYLIPGRGIL